MRKYDLTPVRYLEPTFLPLARNRKSYVCPVCGSGTGHHGSGMTSRDGEYWTCWSCGKSYSKVELFRIQNSLSSYEEACAGLLKHYGIDPHKIEIGDEQMSPVWLSRVTRDALGLYQNAIQTVSQEGTTETHALTDLYDEDPEAYYNMVIARADEMIGKYDVILRACGTRKAPKASLVYDWLGEQFEDSSYQKIRDELNRRIAVCKAIKKMYVKRIKNVSQ